MNITREFREVLKAQERRLEKSFCYSPNYILNPFEPSYMFCDGEITFACAEALKRLRAVVLFHKG